MSDETTTVETPMESDVLERIEKTINKIRPYIQQDGGDIQLTDFKDGIVYVRMIGACAGCIAASSDVSDGIQAILIDEIPEVTEVRIDESTIEPYETFGTGNGGYTWY